MINRQQLIDEAKAYEAEWVADHHDNRFSPDVMADFTIEKLCEIGQQIYDLYMSDEDSAAALLKMEALGRELRFEK